METATLPPNTIVPEVLEKDNYERWSILIEHYLVAQDVWDVVESSPAPEERNTKGWIKKNALALHAIKISCGAKAFDRIKKMHSAKEAWKALLDMPKLPGYHDIAERREVVSSDIAEHHQRDLRKFICNGETTRVERFIYDNRNERSEPDEEILKFALHVAITAGQKDIALFLYQQTKLEFLRGNYGFILLEECIINKMFEIALDILYHFPELATNEPPPAYIPIILRLAQTPPPFLKGSQFKSLKFFIYDCIIVKVDLINPRDVPADDVDVTGGGHSGYQSSGLEFQGTRRWRRQGPLSESVRFNEDFPGWFPINRFSTTSVSAELLYDIPLAILCALVTILSKIFAKQICDIKSTDVYAGEVVRYICRRLSADHNQFERNKGVEATFQAIKNGVPEIAIELAQATKNILWSSTDPEDSRTNKNIFWSTTDPEDSRTMFACAVANRQEGVARFLYGCDANVVYTTDEDGNNTLHLAAKLAPHFQLDRISGAALQLQNELRWFKSIEAIVPRFYNDQKNKDGETPSQVFVKEHKNLLKEAEEWIKKTAESSTVVGALIITIMFAAAFTVPGGNDQSTGFPIFLNATAPRASFTVTPFKVFIVSDAISLFTASSSVLMLLGILTSRYAYEDFFVSLPMKLIIGLSSLFISIATLTVAFCATVYVMLQGRPKEVIPITVLAGIPIMCFVLLQFPLLVEIIALTFRRDIFERKTITAQLVGSVADNIPIISPLVGTVVTRLIRFIYLRSRNR